MPWNWPTCSIRYEILRRAARLHEQDRVKELKVLGIDVPVHMLSSVADHLSLSTDTADLGLAGVFQKPIDTATPLMVLEAHLGG